MNYLALKSMMKSPLHLLIVTELFFFSGRIHYFQTSTSNIHSAIFIQVTPVFSSNEKKLI